MDYDRQYTANRITVENQNAGILNDARMKELDLENSKLGLHQENTNNLFSNLNKNLTEFNTTRANKDAMRYLSLPYTTRLKMNVDDFMKNPIDVLSGKTENIKRGFGGKLKLKY